MENRMHRRFTQSQSLNRLNSLLETVLKYEVLTMRCIFIYLKQPEKNPFLEMECSSALSLSLLDS